MKRDVAEEAIEEIAEETQKREEADRMKMNMWNFKDEDHDHFKCGCENKRMMLAHAYVPWQCYDEAFSPQEALRKGTLFPSLYGAYPIPR
ncbi:MAG: Spore coat protein CotJA [Pelosinus sp.]|jgi:hypothetical protein|nr:Spore coat protein CotJA [Pelosinus sp.]